MDTGNFLKITYYSLQDFYSESYGSVSAIKEVKLNYFCCIPEINVYEKREKQKCQDCIAPEKITLYLPA